ncbi:hypothetical protein V6N12_008240 [Hibiscus sabdariffa]|uniref:Uncharacterized protein n=1 Tax=Hibiscus sabdariffa TaxID=183260 RepID=A0ABR2AN64_9ROSI
MAWVGKENLYEHSRSNKLTRTVLGASTMLWIKGGGVIHRFKGSPHVRHLMDEASSPMCVEMVESVIHVLRDCTPRLLRCGLLLLNKEVVEMKVLATPTSTVAGMDQHVPDRIAKLCLESDCVNALRVIKDNERSWSSFSIVGHIRDMLER